jgi:hypothetical protein
MSSGGGRCFFGYAEQEGVPVDVRRQEVGVGDEDGSDAGLHDFEEADAAGSGSAGTKDEVRGGEGLGVALLAGFAAGLVEVPVVVSAGVFDEHVAAREGEVEEAFAEERGASSLKRRRGGIYLFLNRIHMGWNSGRSRRRRNR